MPENSIIIKRLDIIIKLLALNQIKGNDEREPIILLKSAGLTNQEITNILNKTKNAVNIVLSKARRKQK